MTKEEIERLKLRRIEVNNDYVLAFCRLHDFGPNFDTYWVGGRDETVQIADYFIDRGTLIYAVENDTPEEEFFKWYDYDTDLAWLELPRRINFPSWCKGAPRPYTEEQIAEVRKARARVREAEENLKKCIDEINNKDF